MRHGRYERDLWASVIRFGQTNGAATTINNLSPNTIVTRSPKGRIGTSDTTQLQSDYTSSFSALGRKHDLIAGVDYYQEDARRANNFAGSASSLTTRGVLPSFFFFSIKST